MNLSISMPMASLYLIGIDYLIQRDGTANPVVFRVMERDSPTQEQLRCQWPDGHFVLSLLLIGMLLISNVVFVLLIVSMLSFYAEHIANAKNETLNSM